jgi:signal transduction histidine kinase
MFQAIKKHDSLVTRIFALVAITILLSILLLSSVVIWSFKQSQERVLTTHLAAYMDRLVSATSLDAQGRVMVSHETAIFPHMPFYWQITSQEGPLRKSDLMEDWLHVEAINPGISTVFLAANDVQITLLSKRYIFPGNQEVRFLFGLQADIIDVLAHEEQDRFMHSLVPVFILLTGLLIMMLAYIYARAISRPLAAIKRDVMEVHAGVRKTLDNRYPKEIAILSDEINILLRHNQAIVERYNVFAANLSHALKTPLTVMNNAAKQTPGALSTTVCSHVSDMLGVIDRNLDRTTIMGPHMMVNATIDLLPLMTKIAKGFGKLYGKEVEIVQETQDCSLIAHQADLYEMLGNVIENGCKYAASRLRLTIGHVDERLVITIEDDGCGIAESELEKVIQRGFRLDESQAGSGIGLAVAHHIITLYQGEMTFSKAALGGLSITLSLPSLT